MTNLAEELSTGTDATADTPVSGELMPSTSSESTGALLTLDLGHLTDLAEGKSVQFHRKNKFDRKKVVESFDDAFELVGGTARLAMYAHENYGAFIKQYSKLLPSQNSSALGESNKLEITLNVPQSKLDEE